MDLFRIVMISFVFVILGLTSIYIITVISKKTGKDLSFLDALMTRLTILFCAVIVVAIIAVAIIIGVYS